MPDQSFGVADGTCLAFFPPNGLRTLATGTFVVGVVAVAGAVGAGVAVTGAGMVDAAAGAATGMFVSGVMT